jgi:hypothetical protein
LTDRVVMHVAILRQPSAAKNQRIFLSSTQVALPDWVR